MKLTKSKLKQIIKEELENLSEGWQDPKVPNPVPLTPFTKEHAAELGHVTTDLEYVLERDGVTMEEKFLQPTPIQSYMQGDYNWGPKETALTFKGDLAMGFAEFTQGQLADNGVTVNIEPKN